MVDEGSFIGMITIWSLQQFEFIEHFATQKFLQSKGYGTPILKQVTQKELSKIIVEVEEPFGETALRRIAFYERLGFRLCHFAYFQPPYAADKSAVKLRLMSFPDGLSPVDFNLVKASLYRVVYNFS